MRGETQRLGPEKNKAPFHVIEKRVAGRVRNMENEQLAYMLDQIRAEKEKAEERADKKYGGNIDRLSELIKNYKDENRVREDEIGALIKKKADKGLIRAEEARHSQVLSELKAVIQDLEDVRFQKEKFLRQEMEDSLEQQFPAKGNFDIWQAAIMAELRTRRQAQETAGSREEALEVVPDEDPENEKDFIEEMMAMAKENKRRRQEEKAA